ncbi:MarR family winged helix-turn-helix transcriptional regulator [Arthrobacter sp. EH-1B-1]|uniref:MarR family winged helix-turn-helix transcriptional regulator n=1 Tax=Arthrobacter vasquezii TaxID=2977629 RepID=A0ABT6CXN3_9MICC|nr:MarR family winged helix-turn-helix transcriptional regulator [Arthrobacter vasquezii]MDF9278853.1 MarR family winged helix-turn-helix transcriptional regulator [Arthrobacter vasquezii]
MPESPTESTRELFAHASRLLAHSWNQRLTELGITYAGYLALAAAAADPVSHQAALAKALYVRTPTIGSTLDRLEYQGHVHTYRSPVDTRYRLVRVTAHGHYVLRMGREIERSLLAGSEGLRDQLLLLLPQLMQQPGAA